MVAEQPTTPDTSPVDPVEIPQATQQTSRDLEEPETTAVVAVGWIFARKKPVNIEHLLEMDGEIGK